MLDRFQAWQERREAKAKRRRIEDSNQYVTCRQFKFWRRGAMVGFALLFAGSLGNSYVDRERANDGRQALVNSARVVVIDGCNRDFRNTERLRALLIRAETAIEEQYRSDFISKRRYDEAIKFYEAEIKRLKLPNCKTARNVITDDPFTPVPDPPLPLYPGSPLATEEPKRPG